MNLLLHEQDGSKVAELQGEGLLLREAQDALDLLGTARHLHDCGKLVVRAENIDPDFFRLRTGVAGEILQKFTNYGTAVAIVGDISAYVRDSDALRDFVRESNRGGRVLFTQTLEEALEGLHKLP